jgi:hypothetical protein
MVSKTAFEVEYVEWIDAVASTGWMERGSGFPVQKCHSIGQLIEEGKDHIALAGSWGNPTAEENHVNCVISIPKAWIKVRKKVKV